jgi:hypothetical protein
MVMDIGLNSNTMQIKLPSIQDHNLWDYQD